MLLALGDLLGWVALLLGQGWGIPWILGCEGVFVIGVTQMHASGRVEVSYPGTRQAEGGDLSILWALWLVEVMGAIMWIDRPWVGVAVMLLGSLAASAFLFERRMVCTTPPQ